MPAAQKVMLTPKGIDALPPAPEGKVYVVWDAQQPHLGVRVTSKGARSFIVVKRRPGARDPVTHVIGKYPAVKLKEARERTQAILAMIGDGKVPRQVEAEKQAEEVRRRADTLAVAIEDFIADGALAKLRTGGETEAILRRDFLGQVRGEIERDGKKIAGWIAGPDLLWSKMAVAEPSRRDVIRRLDAIKRERGKHAARHALGAIRKFYNWCVDGERYGVESSPCANVTDRTIGFSRDGRELKRKRVLSDIELADAWAAAKGMAYPFGDAVRLLMLTGQRRDDIAEARWSEIDIEAAMITIPPERMKMDAAHLVPLSLAAVEIIRTLPRFKGEHVFTTTAGARAISGFSKMKLRLDEAIAERRRAEGRQPMAPYVLHDLRRSYRTRLSELRVPSEVAEACIAHRKKGLDDVYNLHQYIDERREAMNRWADRLLSIVEPKPTKPPEETGLDHHEPTADPGTVVSAAEVERARKSRESRA